VSERRAAIGLGLPTAISGTLLVAMVWRFWFVCDDAFILFRYSRHLAGGHGLTFNLGDPAPVEGFSEFLWTIVCALFELSGLGAPLLAPLVTTAGSLLLLVLLVRYGRDALGLGTVGLLAVGLCFAANPTVAIWTSGGLSSSLSALLIFLAFRALFPGRDEQPRGLEAGVFGALACLMRADGPFWIAVLLGIFLVARLLERKPWRAALLRAVGILVVVGAAFLAWRMATFGDYLPNTARAKVGMTALSLERGGKYLAHYLVILPVVGLTGVFGLWRTLVMLLRERRIDQVSAAALMAWATFSYSVIVGGDFMAMGRFFFTAIPFVALVFGRLVQDAAPALRLGWAVAFALSLLPIYDRHAAPAALREALWFRWSDRAYVSEFSFWQGMRDRALSWSELGRACAQVTGPEESLVLGPIGAVGYHSELWIHDLYGLTNTEVLEASEPASVRSSPGHDRMVDPNFFQRYEPTYVGAWVTRRGDKVRSLRANPRFAVFPLEGEEFDGRFLVFERWK